MSQTSSALTGTHWSWVQTTATDRNYVTMWVGIEAQYDGRNNYTGQVNTESCFRLDKTGTRWGYLTVTDTLTLNGDPQGTNEYTFNYPIAGQWYCVWGDQFGAGANGVGVNGAAFQPAMIANWAATDIRM